VMSKIVRRSFSRSGGEEVAVIEVAEKAENAEKAEKAENAEKAVRVACMGRVSKGWSVVGGIKGVCASELERWLMGIE
jgi:hypothetical protein